MRRHSIVYLKKGRTKEMKGISGPGGTAGKNLLATYKPSQVIMNEDGTRKGVFLQVQLDQSNLKKAELAEKADNDPYLVHATQVKNGKTTTSAFYTDAQVKKMEDAAGKTIDCNGGTKLLAFKADINPAGKNEQWSGQRYVVNTKNDILPSDFSHNKASLDKQKAATQAGKDAYAAQKAAQAQTQVETPAVEAEAEAQGPEA